MSMQSSSRRSFLAAMAAVAAPAQTGGLKLSIFSKHLQWAEWPEMAEVAKEIGFDAVDLTVHGGSVLAIAIPHGPVTLDAQGLVERSIALIGSVGFCDELPEAISVLADNPERYRALVTEAVLLEEAAERLTTMNTNPAAGKVVIRL